jgi:hypothetical protein
MRRPLILLYGRVHVALNTQEKGPLTASLVPAALLAQVVHEMTPALEQSIDNPEAGADAIAANAASVVQISIPATRVIEAFSRTCPWIC